MKPYLVDVPVNLRIWIRPYCQRRQFEVVKKARPSVLFLTSDGGRNEKEWKAIHQNRKMFDEEIDWDCKVYKLYYDENMGLYTSGKESTKLIWNTVDRCVFLEDDIIPSVSFFKYCAELLERYKDDERIYCICGMNHLGISEDVQTDYFFSRQGSIWGTATWKRVSIGKSFDYAKDSYVMKLLERQTKKDKGVWNSIKSYPTKKYYGGHVAGGEFWVAFNMYGQNRLQIIPKKNLVSNIGCTSDSAHAADLKKLPRGIRRVFNMPTYELEFPLKHNDYVIPDYEYEKKRNRIMGKGVPVINFFRKIERFFLMAFSGKLLGALKRVFKEREIEK